MEQVVKLNIQTAGRDKTARLLQYVSKVIWYKLEQEGKNGDMFKNLEFQLSSFRKLLRFGKCIDTIYSILPLLNHNDPTVKITVILGKLSNSVFLLADHILWLGRSDMYSVNVDKWSRICSQYWLYSLLMNLLRDFYEILRILQLHKEKIVTGRLTTASDIAKTTCRAVACMQAYPQVVVDLVKNTCDIFLPLAALGYLKLSPAWQLLHGRSLAFYSVIPPQNPDNYATISLISLSIPGNKKSRPTGKERERIPADQSRALLWHTLGEGEHLREGAGNVHSKALLVGILKGKIGHEQIRC